MKITISRNLLHTLSAAVIAACIAGCSDDETAKQPEAPAQATSSGSSETVISKDSPVDPTPEAEESQKQKFEHDFTAQCVERELNNSQNNVDEANKITKSCECISAYIMKDLTDEEAEKFLNEHEHPQSLRIKFEAAAYECLQEKAHPAGPKLSVNPHQ